MRGDDGLFRAAGGDARRRPARARAGGALEGSNVEPGREHGGDDRRGAPLRSADEADADRRGRREGAAAARRELNPRGPRALRCGTSGRNRRRRRWQRTWSSSSIFVLAWVAGAAGAADIPDPAKKLTGSSDDTARSVPTQQGYALQHQKTSWGREYGFRWNAKTRQCVQIMTLGGRVTQVQAKGASPTQARRSGAAAAASAAAANPRRTDLPASRAAPQMQWLLRAGFRQVQSAVNTDDTIYKHLDRRDAVPGRADRRRPLSARGRVQRQGRRLLSQSTSRPPAGRR